jgi:hypothetical protein
MLLPEFALQGGILHVYKWNGNQFRDLLVTDMLKYLDRGYLALQVRNMVNARAYLIRRTKAYLKGIILGILLIAIALTSCHKGKPQASSKSMIATSTSSGGPSTPVSTATIRHSPTPQPSLTSTPTLTPTLTITPTPSFTPLPTLNKNIVSTTPEYPVSAYQLRTWTEDDSNTLVKMGAKWDEGSYTFPTAGDYASAELVFQIERLVRFHQSHFWDPTAWEVARIDPLGISLPGMRPDQDLFMYLAEKILNQEGMDVETLPAELEKRQFFMDQPILVENLFGAGQGGLVFEVRDEWQAIFALHQVNGAYRLEKLQNWSTYQMPSFGIDTTIEYAGDPNNNGLAEIVVVNLAHWSGMLLSAAESLEIYEWNPAKAAFEVSKYDVFNQQCDDGTCEGKWEFGVPDTSGTRPLQVSEYWYTRQQLEAALAGIETPDCPYLEEQRTYLWDGTKYQLTSETFLPPPAEPSKCRIDWAIAAIQLKAYGWQNDEAMNILSEALVNWPDEIDADWGPATRDFIRLQTGIWYDMRGEWQTARKLLQPMVRNPVDPQYGFFAQLAASYLQKRSESGLVGACIQVQKLWKRAIQELPEPEYYSEFVDLSGVRQRWGYTHDRWAHNIEPICDSLEALYAVSPLQEITTDGQLKSWLSQSGIDYFDIQSGDMDGEAAIDHLVLAASSYSTSTLELLAFFNTSKGTTIRYIDRYWMEDEQPTMTWTSFYPDEYAPLINVTQVNDFLRVFSLTPDYQVFELFTENSISSFTVEDGLTIFREDPQGAQQVKTYRWNPASESFIETFTPGKNYDFMGAEQEAERLFFHEQDFPAAILFIEKFLADAPPEPRVARFCQDDICEYLPAWYRPYMRYLLAVAYELSGQPAKAVIVYYLLWQDEPDHIFGNAARLKLVRVVK